MAVQQEQPKPREEGNYTQVGISGPGLKRRYERLWGGFGDCALACKIGYTLGKARGLKECKLQVNNLCQPCSVGHAGRLEPSAKPHGALRPPPEGLLGFPYNGDPCW